MNDQIHSKIRLTVSSILIAFALSVIASAQGQPLFRIGERLTYSVSLNGVQNVAYAETQVVSKGKMAGRDVVELNSKIKTLNFTSAAYYLIDESRTSFAEADTGYPLFVKKTEMIGGFPKIFTDDYTSSQNTYHDISTFLYAIRTATGSGTLNFRSGGKLYTAVYDATGPRKVQTDIGTFETTLINVTSDFLTEHGISSLRINVSRDEAKIPVQIRLRTAQGLYKALIASVRIIEPPPVVETPRPAAAPRPAPTPVAAATPLPYVDNQPLSPELAFSLGETLEYRVTSNAAVIGGFTMRVGERTQFEGADSLLLTALPNEGSSPNPLFSPDDFIRTRVDPSTLSPQQIEVKIAGALGSISQFAKVDPSTGIITVNGAQKIDPPAGTHGLLSFLYAIRSFNLSPSRDLSNPVNDTRVAFFWGSRYYVFSLRPSLVDLITIGEERLPAQQVAIISGDPDVDRLAIKIWLGTDKRRLPLRFSFGEYQADLVLH